MLIALILANSLYLNQTIQSARGISEEDAKIMSSFMTVGYISHMKEARTGRNSYSVKRSKEFGSEQFIEFDNGVEAVVQADGFIRMVRDTRVPWNPRPYPLRDAPVSEPQARKSFTAGLAAYQPQFEWKVERMADMGDASSGNGIWSATGYGFVGYPTVGGVRVGPAAAVDGKINADVPRFEFARFLKLPSKIQQKPRAKITAERADQIAIELSLRGNIMLQPEVRDHAELIISCDSLGILRDVPKVGATRHWMRRDHPKVRGLKGANVGIYGYLVNVRSALNLSECIRSKSAWDITYLIDPEDGSMLAGYEPMQK